ncbi:Oidioi.mRNA.OKI2018_I69.chr2.g4330.t1.cds [Oikopleura dioica]|uniref:Oidioi.mRNA.OKI2018_I69.chr2.g4330.t1.cds n=1 Tax=Oikopleura dioica TaxID=34765 RepID=A0ABN7T0G2_OIKDI|nr:Oidioi.mRNA.OKI2018_I69.chr2.g4330.t1.cds [Oikopleura dioica]
MKLLRKDIQIVLKQELKIKRHNCTTTTQAPGTTTTQAPGTTTTQAPGTTTQAPGPTTTTQAPVTTTTKAPATTTTGAFSFNSDGTGGTVPAPALRHYAVVNGEANAAATGHGPHAADGQVCADGGYLAVGVSTATEGGQIGQCIVSKVMPCATAAQYPAPLGNELNGSGSSCSENFKWAWLNTNNGRYCHAVSVKESADGQYVLATGTRQSTTNNNQYNGFVAKINSATGATIWEFDYTTGAGTRSGFETLHLTSDGGFIVGGFINRVDTEKPGFKSGGQVDQGTPVMHKFSASLAAASSAGSPTPEWSFVCDGSGKSCNLNDGSVKNMRVFSDNGVEKVVGLPTSRSILVVLDAVSGSELAYSGDGINSGFIGDGTANDIEVEKNSSGAVTGFVTTGLRSVPVQTDNGVSCSGDGCSVITGTFTKYKADLSASEWKVDLQTGEWPGGANQFATVAATPYKSLVYTECWGMTSVKDAAGNHIGYVAACGTGIEPGCNIHPEPIRTECNNDPRKAWRGAVARIDLAGNLLWYSINSYQAPNEEAGGAMESGESASEYIFQTPEGRIVSVTDEGFGGFGFLTFECEAGVC